MVRQDPAPRLELTENQHNPSTENQNRTSHIRNPMKTILIRGLAAFIAFQASRSGAQTSTVHGAGAHAAYPGQGTDNTSIGYYAMYSGNSAGYCAAIGSLALYSVNSGSYNAGLGYAALYQNSVGNYNTAIGAMALRFVTASNNTGVGYQAGYNITTGVYNIALGCQAGYYVTTGSNNIDICHPGVASDSGIIRIGIPGIQTVTYIAGAVRIAPKGDLLMGQFNTGSQP
jgi:hypothetical protein